MMGPAGISWTKSCLLQHTSPVRARCAAATARCRSEVPPLTAAPDGRLVACHHPLQS